MNIALGDHQVTNFQSDVEARTIGASTHTPILDPGRWPDHDILWNVPAIGTLSVQRLGRHLRRHRPGPSQSEPTAHHHRGAAAALHQHAQSRRRGPHGAPRGAPLALQLISDFLKPTGAVTNVCGSSPCYAGGYTGPGP